MNYKLLILFVFLSIHAHAQNGNGLDFAPNKTNLEDCFKNGDKLKKGDKRLECLSINQKPQMVVEYLYDATTEALVGKRYYGFPIPATRTVMPNEPDFYFATQRQTYSIDIKNIPTLYAVIESFYKDNPKLTKTSPPDEALQANWETLVKENPGVEIRAWTHWTFYNISRFILNATNQQERVGSFATMEGNMVGFWKPELEYVNKLETFIAAIRKTKQKKYHNLLESEKAEVLQRIEKSKEMGQCNPTFYEKLKQQIPNIKLPVSLDDEIPTSYFMFDIFGISEPNLILAKNALNHELEDQKGLNSTVDRLNIPRFVSEMIRNWSVVGMVHHQTYVDLRSHIQPNLLMFITQDSYPTQDQAVKEEFEKLLHPKLKEKIRDEVFIKYGNALSRAANTFLADNIPCVL